MTFTDYLIRNCGLDLRQSAQIMAMLFKRNDQALA